MPGVSLSNNFARGPLARTIPVGLRHVLTVSASAVAKPPAAPISETSMSAPPARLAVLRGFTGHDFTTHIIGRSEYAIKSIGACRIVTSLRPATSDHSEVSGRLGPGLVVVRHQVSDASTCTQQLLGECLPVAGCDPELPLDLLDLGRRLGGVPDLRQALGCPKTILVPGDWQRPAGCQEGQQFCVAAFGSDVSPSIGAGAGGALRLSFCRSSRLIFTRSGLARVLSVRSGPAKDRLLIPPSPDALRIASTRMRSGSSTRTSRAVELSDDQTIGLLREIAGASYTQVRPNGWRVIRAGDLLALARARVSDDVSEDDLDAAIAQIGGDRADITNPVYALGQLLRRRSIWRVGYAVPAEFFDGVALPSRFRAPRFRIPG